MPAARPAIRVARVYDAPEPTRGVRVLVDRLWPRGIRREGAPWDEWLPEVAPSTDLRRWYAHDPAKFAAFAERYRAELASGPAAAALGRLRALAASGGVVLVTATRDVPRSAAAVLCEVLGGGAPGPAGAQGGAGRSG